MLSKTYELYVLSVIKLTKSLIIKSVQTIETINTVLKAGGHTISEDPNNWKYYMNLNGEYFTGNGSDYFTDIPMTIFSIDINAVITLTRETILTSPITYAELLTYGDTFIQLVNTYPEQEMLIRGILTPVNKATAIAADDLTILSYSTDLVCPNEVTLIQDIQSWINNYKVRWFVPAFAVSDRLYPASFLAVLYLAIPGVIINIRLNNCKTAQVHEFHLWNYLAGYYRLDRFKNKIPYTQALYLYRNIEYLTHNAGCRATMDMLHNDFALPYGLQLYSFVLRQDANAALENLNSNKLTSLTNSVRFNKYPYGEPGHIEDITTYVPTNQVVNKLLPLAKLNPVNFNQDIIKINDGVLHTPITELPTGIIECNVLKNSSSNLINILQEKLQYWLYLSANGRIRYKYNLTTPSLGVTTITLDSKSAIVILLHIANRLQKIDTDIIPDVIVRGIPTVPRLSETALKKLIEKKYWQGMVVANNIAPIHWDRYQDIASAHTVIPTVVNSLPEFLRSVDTLMDNKIRHILLPSLEYDSMGRSELASIVNQFYTHHTCLFTEYTTYTEFFYNLGLNFNDVNDSGLLTIANLLLKAFIGVDTETVKLQSPYSDMVQILEIISSYTLQFVLGNTSSNIEPIDWPYMYPKPFMVKYTGSLYRINVGLDVNDRIPLMSRMDVEHILATYDTYHNTKITLNTSVMLDVGLDSTFYIAHNDSRNVPLNSPYPFTETPTITE